MNQINPEKPNIFCAVCMLIYANQFDIISILFQEVFQNVFLLANNFDKRFSWISIHFDIWADWQLVGFLLGSQFVTKGGFLGFLLECF